MCTKKAALVNLTRRTYETFSDIAGKAGIETSFYPDKTLLEVFDRVKMVDIIIISLEKVTADLISKMPNLKVIARMGAGLDNIDIEAATRADVAVINTPDYCTEEVALHTCSLILAGNRKLAQSNALVRKGNWQDWTELKPIYPLSSLTLGLIGIGNIGEKVASFMKGFECKMIAFDPHKPAEKYPDGVVKASLEEVLAESDIITLHLPLTSHTKYFINKNILSQMKKKPLFINVSRGGIVNQYDLADALDCGVVAYALLDVLENEPPEKGNPLLEHPKVFVTNHIAWYSENSSLNLDRMIAERVVDYMEGREVPTLVNREVLKKK